MAFTIIIFIITLLVLVISHEMGHFLAAKKFGVKVLEFGFGIPPKVWGKKIGETIYSLNWFPVGGFVRLYGEDEVDKKVLENERSFASKPVYQRIIVVVAGVTMNMLLAFLMFYIVIISQDFKIIYPTAEPVAFIASVEENSPAQKAGIGFGDQVIAIDGEKVKTIEEATVLIKQKPNQPISITLSDIDKKATRDVTLTPMQVGTDGKIGVHFTPLAFREYRSTTEKIFSGISYSGDLIKLTFVGLGVLFTDVGNQDFDKASKSVSGPVGLVSITGDILSLGSDALLPYLWFVGILSLTLATMNILPFPALDGGRLIFLAIEGIFRKKVKAEVERIVHTVGMAILLGLIFLITFSDIRKLIF